MAPTQQKPALASGGGTANFLRADATFSDPTDDIASIYIYMQTSFGGF